MAIQSSTLAWKSSWTEESSDYSLWGPKESNTTERVRLHIHTYTHTHTRIHTYTYTYTHIHTYTYTHIHTHTHTHTYTYTHIHIHNGILLSQKRLKFCHLQQHGQCLNTYLQRQIKGLICDTFPFLAPKPSECMASCFSKSASSSPKITHDFPPDHLNFLGHVPEKASYLINKERLLQIPNPIS